MWLGAFVGQKDLWFLDWRCDPGVAPPHRDLGSSLLRDSEVGGGESEPMGCWGVGVRRTYYLILRW